MSQQHVIGVSERERPSQQRIIEENDLPDREVVRRTSEALILWRSAGVSVLLFTPAICSLGSESGVLPYLDTIPIVEIGGS